MSAINTHDDRTSAIAATAGAGFRLSLVLNAVKMQMQNADNEIQNISRGISDYSLMLKQVARTMEEGGIRPTPLAIDTVSDIKDHSEHIFEEIKGMTELAQVRDEDGNLKEIGIGQKVVWSFKQQKVPYLLGQLDYLRLNLAIMLQILQLAKVVAPTKPRPSDKFLTQERAEIQNMIVLQHWSHESLKTLFHNANEATRRDSLTSNGSEDPPPTYEEPAAEEVRLAVAPPKPPKEEDTSKAIVKYQERPIQQLDDALHQALSRENQALSAQVPDIVNHLLRQWTIPDYPSPGMYPSSRALTNGGPHSRSNKYSTTISSDESDTTESDFSDDSHPRGFYLEGPDGSAPKPNGVKKKLRFKDQQAQVESDSDEEDHRKRRGTKGRSILRSNSSDDSDTSPPPTHRRRARAPSDDSPPSSRSYDRTRRPYSGPSGPRNSPPEKEPIHIPPQRGVTPSPRQGPVPSHWQPLPHQGPQGAGAPSLRPPPPHMHSHPGATRRASNAGPYVPTHYAQPQGPQSPNASPVMNHGQFFPQNQRGPTAPQGTSSPFVAGGPREWPPRERDRERDRGGRPKSSHSTNSSYEGKNGHGDKGRRDKKEASRNIKKGIGIGAAAAGLMELLSGLDAI